MLMSARCWRRRKQHCSLIPARMGWASGASTTRSLLGGAAEKPEWPPRKPLCTWPAIAATASCPVFDLPLSSEGLRRYVGSEMGPFEVNAPHRAISGLARTSQIVCPSRNPENAASAGEHPVTSEARPGMKYFHVARALDFLQTSDHFALLVSAGITTGGHHDAYRGTL